MRKKKPVSMARFQLGESSHVSECSVRVTQLSGITHTLIISVCVCVVGGWASGKGKEGGFVKILHAVFLRLLSLCLSQKKKDQRKTTEDWGKVV